jgi:hypothetical protein
MRDTIEKVLARYWILLLGVVIGVTLVSCAASHVGVDQAGNEVLVTTGEHILPGAADTIGEAIGAPVEDVVGAVGDAVESADIPDVIDNVATGRWFSAVMSIVGIGVAIFAGVKKRQTLRDALVRVKRKVIG